LGHKTPKQNGYASFHAFTVQPSWAMPFLLERKTYAKKAFGQKKKKKKRVKKKKVDECDEWDEWDE